MNHHFPKTKLTRGTLSGASQLLVATLLLLPASHLLIKAFQSGTPAFAIISFFLILAACPFINRCLNHFSGQCVMLYCDERALAIRESPDRLHVSMLTGLKRIARDGLGYTLHLESGPQFHLRHMDANPRLRAILDAQHERLEKSFRSAADSSE